jgi:serine/threonine protein kinase
VVKASRDHGFVAVKIYRHRGLGSRDRKRVVQEALLLARASHQNVVRCFGVVHDPDNPNDSSNIDGSLVMEWVYGGDLYMWLQDNDCSFRDRLFLVAQVCLLAPSRHPLLLTWTLFGSVLTA